MFFAAIRTHVVLPTGIKLRKSLKDINRMTYETMLKCYDQTENGERYDYMNIKQSYEEGKWLYEHDR